jgi:hypothetical protein
MFTRHTTTAYLLPDEPIPHKHTYMKAQFKIILPSMPVILPSITISSISV